jgi:hypothetical protein
MSHSPRTRLVLHAASLAACAAAAVLASAPALARSSDADARARYASERAACLKGSSNQDRATCLKEAGAALQEARRGQLATAAGSELESNRVARCEVQRGADRDDCVLRMQGAGTAPGSAQGGGILRELSRPDGAK